MERTPASCMICGETRRALLVEKDGWTVYRCEKCRLGVLDPRPSAEELKSLYAENYFDDQYGRGLAVGSPEMKRRISQEDHRVKFVRRHKKKGKILDIGCGMGYFLFACRIAGYDVEGADISDHAAAYVSKELGIPIRTGGIETLSLPEGSLDVVTMWHFLEHVPRPAEYLESARRWLRSDGLLVIDVPNYLGTDGRKNGTNWVGWQLPFHLYHYTPSSLSALLAAHGFEIVGSKDYHSEYVKNRLKRIPVVGLFARLVAKCYSGTSYAVSARKR
ncbi:MAG TPA: class I SAM-dependent methyltransferase [Syntrophales bacterium]|nr:class I SAM-dependent methyltransferase [Syntrophales bacterium]